MALKRLFVSFDFDNDARLKDLFVGQSKHDDTPFEFADWSSKAHLTGDWKEQIKKKLAYVDVMCVLCGKNMASASGVSVEIDLAKALGIPYFLLAGYEEGSTKPVSANGDKLYKWTWDNLKKLVNGDR